MFLLGKSGGPFLNDYYLESDEFGWWLNTPEPLSVISTASRGSSSSLKDKSSSRSSSSSTSLEPFENRDDEVCSAEEPLCQSSSRSYTPERLVRTQDYAIQIRSPTFSSNSTPFGRFNSGKRERRINCLIDQRLVGASQLEALFEQNSPEIELPVPLANGRKISPGPEALLDIANADSPRRSYGTLEIESSDSSCEGFERTEFGNLRIDYTEESGDEIIAVESWKIRDDSYLVDEASDHPEFALRQLRGRIQNLRDINKDIFCDIETLRRNFQVITDRSI